MSNKTIEIASIHKGTINVKVKGEGVNVEFVDKGEVGLALCDHDEAASFLSIGLPDYWKPTVDADASGKEKPAGKIATAGDHIALIRAATTVEAVEGVVAAEEALVAAGSMDECRKSVMDEAAKKSKALAAKE